MCAKELWSCGRERKLFEIVVEKKEEEVGG